MNKAFEKLLAKKKAGGEEMPEGRMKARSSVLDDLMSNMDDRESKKLGMKKVSVMAPDEDGLKEGLDAAKEVVGNDNIQDALGEDSDEDLEDHEMSDEMTKEQLQAQIDELKMKLAKAGM